MFRKCLLRAFECLNFVIEVLISGCENYDETDLPNLSLKPELPVEHGTMLTITCNKGFALQRGGRTVECLKRKLVYAAKPQCIKYSELCFVIFLDLRNVYT